MIPAPFNCSVRPVPFRRLRPEDLATCPLLSAAAASACACACVLLIAGARKSVGQRHGHRRLLSPVSSGARLHRGRHRQSALRNQLHRPLDRNPYLALRLVNPAVVVQQQIFARMQVGHVLVAVVGLQPRRGELLRQFRDLVLHLRVGGQVAELANIHRLRPFAVGPVFLVHVRVDHLADAVAEHRRHHHKNAQRGQERRRCPRRVTSLCS